MQVSAQLIKKEISNMQTQLDNLIATGTDYNKVLKLSEKLDKLIVQYYRVDKEACLTIHTD